MITAPVIIAATIASAISAALAPAPFAHAQTAQYGWIAVASSPSRESLDWAYGPDRSAAHAKALNQCTHLQKANNCQVLASGPSCVAVAWDAAQPLNRPYAASSNSSHSAVQNAMAAAGPYANDPTVRCTWFS